MHGTIQLIKIVYISFKNSNSENMHDSSFKYIFDSECAKYASIKAYFSFLRIRLVEALEIPLIDSTNILLML